MWTLSSAARMVLDVPTPALIRASAMRLVVAGEMPRCSKTVLRPQATWAKTCDPADVIAMRLTLLVLLPFVLAACRWRDGT